MSRTCPKYIPQAELSQAPIQYKWNKSISKKIFSEEVNPRLFQALQKTTYKASFSLGIASMEWIVYRFAGHTDIKDAVNRIEAAWASAINVGYSKSLEFWLTETASNAKDLVGAPLEISLALLFSMHHRYSQNNLNTAVAACRQMMLAEHVTPQSGDFEGWLSRTLRKLASTFPQQATSSDENYEWSREETVPREFFEEDFVYSKEAFRSALRNFLASLNPAQNPYLRTPEEMKAEGFAGTPYSL